MVEDALGEDDVEAAVGERWLREVGLEEASRQVALGEALGRDVHRLRDVHA